MNAPYSEARRFATQWGAIAASARCKRATRLLEAVMESLLYEEMVYAPVTMTLKRLETNQG